MLHLVFCWGLPGSGKTRYCKEQVLKSSKNNIPIIINLDTIKYESLKNKLFCYGNLYKHTTLYLDGLILNNSTLINILSYIRLFIIL